MTARRIILSGQNGVIDTTDGIMFNVGYLGAESVFETAAWGKGSSVATFGGHLKIAPHVLDFPPRQIAIDPLYVINGNGAMELHHRAHDLWYLIQGRPGRIQVGSLYMPVMWDGPPKNKTRFESTTTLEMSLSGEALPSYWTCLYGYQVGRSQGIYVIDDRLDHTSLIATTSEATAARVFVVENPGTAPTKAAMFLSVASGTFTSDVTIYVRNVNAATSERVAVKVTKVTNGAGYAYISPAMGLVLMPGTNTIRLENQDGTLETQTDSGGTPAWKHAIYGTEARYLGDEIDLFNEGPAVWSLHRRGAATYGSAASGTSLSSVGYMAPRIGSIWRAYAAASIGLCLEGQSTNVCLQSEDAQTTWVEGGIGVVTATNTTAPDGTATADTLTDNAAGSSENISQAITITSDSTWWCFSTFIKKDSDQTRFPAILVSFSGGTSRNWYGWLNTQTGATQGTSDTGYTGQVGAIDAGDYWRLWAAIQNNGTGNTTVTVYIYPAAGSTIGTFATSAQGSAIVWGHQLENLPLPSSYIKTTTVSVIRGADHCAVWSPHNYLKYGRDLTQNATTDTGKWVRSSGLTVAKDATVGDGTAFGDTLTLAAASDYIYQSVTPDVRPNAAINGFDTGWTAIFSLRQGTITGSSNSIDIQIENSNGTVIGTATNIKGSDMDASNTRSFLVYVTNVQIGASQTGFRVKLKGNTGTGTVIVESVRFVRGIFPGRLVVTEGNASLADPAHWDWPWGWQQNGWIQFKAVLPPISTGTNLYLFGGGTADAITLYRPSGVTVSQNYLTVGRRSDGGVQTMANVDVGNVWDGTLHTFKIEWLAYTRSGTNYMFLRVYVDGTLKSADSNKYSAGIVTKWTPGERLIWSDGQSSNGHVFATVRDFTMGSPTWTAGDIPDGNITT